MLKMLSTKPRSGSPNAPRPSSSRKRSDVAPGPARSPSTTGPNPKTYEEPKQGNGYVEPKHGEPHEHHHGHHHHEHPKHGEPHEPKLGNGYGDGHSSSYTETTTIEIFKTKTTEEIIKETRVDFKVVTEEVIGLLTCGETDVNGVVVVESGEWFLESVLRKFQVEFIEKWKIEFLFPAIRIWIEKHIVEYIERIIVITREKIIKEFEEKIIIIKKEHDCELKRREQCQRELYLEVIKKAWAAYSKTMNEIEFVKEVRFKYKQTEEREVWGEFIKELGPELLEFCPKVYQADFCVDDCRHYGMSLKK
jgi:hypothetical protein